MAKKYIDADILKAEIDRRYQEYRAKMKTDDFTYYEGMADSLDLLEQFLDTLQEQTLTDCNELQEPEVDLEKEVEKYFQGLWPGMETAEQCNTDMHFTPPAIMRLAHHFANWQKEQMIRDCSVQASYEAEIEKAEERGYNLCKEQMLQLAKNRYEVVMAFGTGNPDVDHALQMDRLALVKIIEEDKK